MSEQNQTSAGVSVPPVPFPITAELWRDVVLGKPFAEGSVAPPVLRMALDYAGTFPTSTEEERLRYACVCLQASLEAMQRNHEMLLSTGRIERSPPALVIPLPYVAVNGPAVDEDDEEDAPRSSWLMEPPADWTPDD